MDIWIYRCMDIYIYMRYMDILINGYIDILINGYMDISGVSCIYQGLNVYLSVVFPAYQVFQLSKIGFKERMDKKMYMSLHMWIYDHVDLYINIFLLCIRGFNYLVSLTYPYISIYKYIRRG